MGSENGLEKVILVLLLLPRGNLGPVLRFELTTGNLHSVHATVHVTGRCDFPGEGPGPSVLVLPPLSKVVNPDHLSFGDKVQLWLEHQETFCSGHRCFHRDNINRLMYTTGIHSEKKILEVYLL